MAAAGNFTALQRMREQSFQGEAALGWRAQQGNARRASA